MKQQEKKACLGCDAITRTDILDENAGYCDWCDDANKDVNKVYENPPQPATVEDFLESEGWNAKDSGHFDYNGLKALLQRYTMQSERKPEPMGGKSLDECKDEVARKYGQTCWNNLITFNHPPHNIYKSLLEKCYDEVAELYASQKQPTQSATLQLTEDQYTALLNNPWIEINGVEYCRRSRVEELMQKAVDTVQPALPGSSDFNKNTTEQRVQEWISVEDRLPENGQVIDVWKMWYNGSWGRQTNVVFEKEHIIEYSHWRPLPSPPNGHE